MISREGRSSRLKHELIRALLFIALASALLDLASIAVVLGLLQHVQQNRNRYWDSLENVTVVDLNVGAGEVILAVIGVLTWIITITSIFSSSFRAL